MKKLILGFLIILSANVFAQQKGISYQAVIINPSDISAPGYNAVGTPLANKSICISFQILNAAAQSEYQESQTTTTDQYGMVNLVIGNGSKIGGSAVDFNAITWSLGSKTLVVAVNTTGTCSSYTEISRQALNYVPYALYASDANVKDGFITTAKLADGSVTDAKVAAGINKTKVGLGNVDNTSDANKQVSIAAQAALNLKEDVANKSNDNALGTSNVLFPTQNAVKTYVDTQVAGATIADANSTTKGKIQLTGDLGGTAASPTVPALANKENSANKSATTTLGTSDVLFPTQNAVKTYVDTQVAGATIADANSTTKGKIQLAGDLAGTAASPTVPALANKENSANKSATTTLGTSDVLFPTQNAVKAYVDTKSAGYLALTGGNLSGTLSGTTINAAIFSSSPQVLTPGGNITWPASNGLNASVTLNANSTLAFSATPPLGVYGTLIVAQPATGGPFTLTLPTALTNKVLGSSTATVNLSTTANAKDILTFYYDGSTCFWNVGQGYGEDQTITAGAYAGILPVANGGSGVSTLTGIVKANGTSAYTAAVAADFPTLNQNTTGTAANVSGTVAVANGGTGATTLTGMLKGNGTSAITAAVAGTDYVAPATLSNYLPLAGGTLSGAVTGTTITAPVFASTPQTLTPGATITWTATAGLNASVTLNSNSTLAFSATPPVGVYGTLVVKQPASGGPYTLALPTALTNSVLGSSTGAVTLSTTANAKDVLTFYYDGTTCYWNVGQGYGEAATAAATNLATGTSGTLPVANGGTGLTATPANGQIDIGNGTGFTRATLTAGTAITITNTAGTITIAAAVRPTTDQIIANAAQTSFTLTQTSLNAKVWMFINGVRTNNNAYSISGTTITYTPANNNNYTIVVGDRVQFDYAY